MALFESLLKTWIKSREFKISEKINLFKYQLLDYLETIELSQDPQDPLIHCLIQYCPPSSEKNI